MGRVSQETLEKLSAFIESLPEEARGKCAICNETLCHIVKQAEATIGAGTATVTRILAEKINENAAPQDRVEPGILRDRVRNKETDRNLFGRNATIEQINAAPPPLPPQPPEIAAISNGHYDTDSDGKVFPIRDPELRKKEHAVTMLIYPHLFEPIEGLSDCPVSARELYNMIPGYCLKRLEKIDAAIEFLMAIQQFEKERSANAND